MPTVTQAPLSGRYLSFAEREEIALLRATGCGVREIARQLGRSPSTISRELRRNAATRSGRLDYRASTAQWHADLRARRPKSAKLAVNAELRRYVQDRLSETVKRPDGSVVRVRRSGGSGAGMAVARTGAGARRGVLSRYRIGCAWTSPMMSRCVSRTRRSISRCSSRGAARCAVS
jgi:transposase-like protein